MKTFFVVILLTLSSVYPAAAQGMRPANEVSIVALIITSGAETPVAASVTRTLESLNAQTLTANAPNASEMRSILKRFAAAVITTDVALVYYDGAVLRLGDREFVAPGGIELRRKTDLLTKAIPLSALARATALANSGGAVLVHSSGQNVELIDGVTLVETAPAMRTGTSPILFATSAAAMNLADALGAMANTTGNIDLNDALRELAALTGVSISQQPVGSVMLRQIPAPEAEAETEAEAAAAEAAADAGQATGINLPQVGADTPAEAGSDTAAESPVADASAPEAGTAPDDLAVSDADTATDDPAAAENTAAPGAAAEEDAIPLDVLEARQRALTRGQKRTLQRHLRNLGFYGGLIDGIFGPQSERAISAYQESIGAAVTGVLTPSQLEALSE